MFAALQRFTSLPPTLRFAQLHPTNVYDTERFPFQYPQYQCFYRNVHRSLSLRLGSGTHYSHNLAVCKSSLKYISRTQEVCTICSSQVPISAEQKTLFFPSWNSAYSYNTIYHGDSEWIWVIWSLKSSTYVSTNIHAKKRRNRFDSSLIPITWFSWVPLPLKPNKALSITIFSIACEYPCTYYHQNPTVYFYLRLVMYTYWWLILMYIYYAYRNLTDILFSLLTIWMNKLT